MQYIYMELYEPHIYAIIEFSNVSHAIAFNIQSGLKSLQSCQLEKFLWWSVGGCERYSVRERGYKVGEGIPLSRPLCIGIYMRKFKQSSFRKPNVQVFEIKTSKCKCIHVSRIPYKLFPVLMPTPCTHKQITNITCMMQLINKFVDLD